MVMCAASEKRQLKIASRCRMDAINDNGQNGKARERRADGLSGSGAISLGTNMAAGMALLGGGGFYIDHRRGGGFAFTLGGIVLGLVYCAYEAWKIIKQLHEQDRNNALKKGSNTTL